MFVMNDDLSIYATRGDIVFFSVSADDNGILYKFQPGDIVRMAIYGKKEAENCVMQKDFPVTEVTEEVFIYLEEEDTKIGDIISKHRDYWYEIVLNPDTMPQTIIGYDEDGAKVFRLFPESEEIDDNYAPKEEDFPVVDSELDMTSPRPVANSAVARAVATILDTCERTNAAVAKLYVTPQMFGAIGDGLADDTEAFQNAIDSGFSVFIPSGVYAVKSLTIPKTAPVDIEGASTKRTILKNIGNGSVLTCDGLSGDYYQDLSIKNFTITSGYDVANVGDGVRGISLIRCARLRLENVFIEKQYAGVYIDGCWNMYYDNVTCYTNKNGWVIDNKANNLTAVANLHHKCTSDNNEVGVDIRGNYVFTWNGGEIGGNTYGVLIDSSGEGRVYGSCLSNITMENNRNAIVIGTDNGTAPSNVEINNCYIFAYAMEDNSVAINSHNCLRLSLINNTISKYDTAVVSNGYSAAFIANNRIYECAKSFVCGGNEYPDVGSIGAVSRNTFATFDSNGVLTMRNSPKSIIPNGGLVINNGVLKFKDLDGRLYAVTATLEN